MTKNNFFDANYFAVYGNDDQRLQMYRAEKIRIEKHKSSGRILDIGCGIGAFLDEFNSESWEKYGVDISCHAIEIARAKGILVLDPTESYNYSENYFDVIVMRGSLQHMQNPFEVLGKCFELLKPGGYFFILATPNSNSPYYSKFKTLPTLTADVNWLIPSDLMIRNVLLKIGFNVVRMQYPYLETPYARPFMDLCLYLISFLGFKTKRKFAFWKSVMEIHAQKPTH